jgi:acetoin utilization deacetylase AcuC-like enzyme
MTIQVVYTPFISKTLNSKSNKITIPTEVKADEFVRKLGWHYGLRYHGLVHNYEEDISLDTSEYLTALLKVHDKDYFINAKPGWGSIRNALANNYALIHATKINKDVVFAPVSGFHHAGYDYGWGFCTFNGLVAAALDLNCKVLILDGDQHVGDGTIDIINRLGLHDQITNYSIKEWDDIPSFEGYDHIIYQAGADAHYLDGGYLNDETWVKRDQLVFQQAKKLCIPITVTFAGGYSSLSKVVELHLSTYWKAYEIYRDGYEAQCIKSELDRPVSRDPTDQNCIGRHLLYGELHSFCKHAQHQGDQR